MIRLILTVIFVVSFVYADITTDVDITPGGTVTGTGTDDKLIWQQLPGTIPGILLTSQYFLDFDQTSEVADDFRFYNSEFFEHVRWWGAYSYCTGTEPFDPEFSIYIYPDIGEEPAAPYSGLHLAEYTIPSGTTGETYDPVPYNVNRYIYETDVIDFFTIANTKYWIVYQAHLDYGAQGMWGIASTNEGDVWEHDVYFTGDAFGYTTWQDGVSIFGYEVDIAHEIYNWAGWSGFESTTWGSIKTIF